MVLSGFLNQIEDLHLFDLELCLYMLLLLLSCFSRVWLCVTPKMAAHQAPPSLGFSRQEHWSGLPFPCLYTLVCKVHLHPALPYPEWTNGISSLLQALSFMLLCEEGEKTQCSVFMNSAANNFWPFPMIPVVACWAYNTNWNTEITHQLLD